MIPRGKKTAVARDLKHDSEFSDICSNIFPFPPIFCISPTPTQDKPTFY